MAQEFWTYSNNDGHEFTVSIYHGENSVHLVIYCGEEILKIDFNVTTDKNYTFMLQEELFELQIKFQEDKTRYFLINTNTNRPVKYIERSKFPYTHHLTSIGIFIITVVIILAMVYFFI